MASTVSKEDADAVLHILGLEPSDDNRDQLRIMAESLTVYEEREKVRGGLWKISGAGDSAHNLKHKGLRVAFASDQAMMEAAVDDAHDAINYAAFFIRNVRAGRLKES